MSKCLVCGEEAKWERITQFAGIHPYCDELAKQEDDFSDEWDSYSFWDEVDDED